MLTNGLADSVYNFVKILSLGTDIVLRATALTIYATEVVSFAGILKKSVLSVVNAGVICYSLI